MGYCVNCGAEYTGHTFICRSCWKDPRVPNKQWDKTINNLQHNDDSYYPDFTYKHEKLSLVLAVIVSASLIFILTTISVGTLLIAILIMALVFRINWIHTRAGLMEVTRHNYSDIYGMAQIAAGRLRVPMPPVYVMQDPIPNAFTMGLFDENWIVINSGIMELLTKDELLTVIGHEMGHIKYRHATWLVLTNPRHNVRFPLLAHILRPIFNNWHLRSEYSADRAGLIASGEIRSCILTEIKLMAGKRLPPEFDLDKYLKQLEERQDSASDSLLEVVFRTHPFAKNRIRQMLDFHRSEKFQNIWNRYSTPGELSFAD